MHIGEVAARTGVSVQALRYYERRGLLEPPARRPSGYREFAPSVVRRVRAIKWAQGLGFRLGEIRELVRLGLDHMLGPPALARAKLEAKVREIDEEVRRLKAMRASLRALAACRCDGECPILARALGDPDAMGRSRGADHGGAGWRTPRKTKRPWPAGTKP